MMFKPNDTVIAKNPNLPFWMTVKRVREDIKIAYCYFGTTNNYAGGFQFNELQSYEQKR